MFVIFLILSLFKYQKRTQDLIFFSIFLFFTDLIYIYYQYKKIIYKYLIILIKIIKFYIYYLNNYINKKIINWLYEIFFCY